MRVNNFGALMVNLKGHRHDRQQLTVASVRWLGLQICGYCMWVRVHAGATFFVHNQVVLTMCFSPWNTCLRQKQLPF